MLYWVGQKVRSGFSVRSYGKTQTNFLANPIYNYGELYICNYIYNYEEYLYTYKEG